MARSQFAVVLLVIVTLFVGWCWMTGPVHEKVDARQERLDVASAPLTSSGDIGQTFRSDHSGLCAVELLLVVYNPSYEPPAGAELVMSLRRLDQPDAEPLRVALAAQGWQHNDVVRFSFDPLSDSRDLSYQLTIECDAACGLGVWHTSSDAYSGGQMVSDGQGVAGDLYFRTYYAYNWLDGLRYGALALLECVRYVPALLLVLFLPGWVVALWLGLPQRFDVWMRVGVVATLSVAFWALVVLWAGALGISLAGIGTWVVVGLLALPAGWALASGRTVFVRVGHSKRRDWSVDLALGLVLLVVVATRLLNIRDLAVPAWVDSVHHTVVTSVIAREGHVPETLLPYVQVDGFHYHFGFHAVSAALVWLSGLEAYQAVLLVGQVLNALAPLGAYALTTWFLGRRWSGALAALVVGALAYLPAYYVSWGRYTHLAGLILLPFACLFFARYLRKGGGTWLAGSVVMAAGLGLTHYRALYFYVAFCLCYVVYAALRHAPPQAVLRLLVRTGLVGCLALVLVLPWVVRFVVQVLPTFGSTYLGWGTTAPSLNAFPVGLLKAHWMGALTVGAGLGIVWGLIRRSPQVMLLVAWVGTWFLLANLRLVGLADTWFLDNSAVVISLWLPVAILCGWLIGDVTESLAGRLDSRRGGSKLFASLRSALLLGIVPVLGLVGCWRHVDVVNPVTILATKDDVYSMTWIRQSTPSDALFLINARQWQGDLWVGSDGGWWLPLLAGRQVTLPCVLYHEGGAAYREELVGLAAAVEGAASVDDPALLERLEDRGVTHVYVGARGGRLMPADLDPSPHYRLVYASGPVRVYEFISDPTAD